VQISVASDSVLVWGEEEALRLDLASGAERGSTPYPGVDPQLGEFAVDRACAKAIYGRHQGSGIKVWSLGQTETTEISTEGGIVSLELSADGSKLLTVSELKLAQAFDAASGEETGRRRLVGHGSLITGAFSAAGDRVLAVSYDKASVFGIEQEGVKPLRRVACGGDNFGWGDISDDASLAVLVRASGEVCLWDDAGLRTLGSHSHEARHCWLTPNAERAVSVAWSQPVDAPFQQEIKVWDVQAGTELRGWSLETDPLAQVALTPDGSALLLCHPGPRVEAHDVATGEVRWVTGEAATADYHPGEPTGRCVLVETRDDPSDGTERDRAGGRQVSGLAEWPRCPACSNPQTLLLTLAADPRKLPLERHSGLALFACLQGCVTQQVRLLSGDAVASLPAEAGGADALTARALLFEPADDAEDAQYDAPAKLGGAPEWPARTIERVCCEACGETMTYRVQLQPGKDLWEQDLFDALGDFGWVFVCPSECTARVLFWSY
jgi:hypothetical protein